MYYHNDIEVQFHTENFEKEIHSYTHLYGWPIDDETTIGLDGGSVGYYLHLQVKGDGGKVREVSILLSQEALEKMLTRVVSRFGDKDDTTDWQTTGFNDPVLVDHRDDYDYSGTN